jgi:hypothetical protein
VKRVEVLREPTVAGIGQLAAMQTAAPLFEVELQPIDVRDVSEFALMSSISIEGQPATSTGY